MAHLAGLGFESFMEESDTLLAYLPAGAFTPELKQELHNPVSSELIASYSTRLIHDQNWNALWESAYEPVEIDDKCRIRAPFHESSERFRYDIVIEPKMSFGTAHHETTRLMIRFLLQADVSGTTFLDMGSGTAVLAILAALRGAVKVTAIDNDEWAYQNAFENIAHNKVDTVEVLHGDAALLADKKFGVIFANINWNILLRDMPAYKNCLTTGGMLFMSGFYEEDLLVITSKAAELGFSLLSSMTDNRWTAAGFKIY
jgi:ribosomal protein L11 methyltransferase